MISNKNKILAGVILLLAASLWPSSQTKAYEGVRPYDCTVLDSYDDGNGGRDSITLRQAITQANMPTRGNQRCRRSITIKTTVINLTAPLVVDIRFTDRENLGGVDYYLFEGQRLNNQNQPVSGGAPAVDRRVTLNFDNYTPPAGSDPEKKCAVVFKNTTRNIILRNINVEGVRPGSSGICFEGADEPVSAEEQADGVERNATELGANNIKLENVRVAQVQGGHGIVVGNGANTIEIDSESELDEISRDGLHILNVDPLAHITLEGTDRPYSETTMFGTANFGSTDTPRDFVLSQIAGADRNAYRFVSSVAPVNILVSRVGTEGSRDVSSEGQTVFTISGAVVNGAATCTSFSPITDRNIQSQLEQRLKRIHVYAVGYEQANTAKKARPVFLTYVTKKSGGAFGIEEGRNDASSAGNYGGIFNFKLLANGFIGRINRDQGLENSPVTAITKIVLLPELIDGSITSSSDIVLLTGGRQAPNVCAGAEGPSGGGSGGYQLLGSMTKQQCQLAFRGQPAPEVFDSDGDGIPDYLEDLNHDCECNENEFSCWNDPDSDGDGLLDSVELNGGEINPGLSGEGFCRTESGGTDLCNVDGDTLSNAQDPDSDGDTLDDVIEDRSRVFNASAKAYYYMWDSSLGPRQIYLGTNADGTKGPVECTSRIIQNQRQAVGAFYAVYRVKADGIGTPMLHHYEDDIDLDEELRLLACINETAGLNSFDGDYAGPNSGETPVYSPTHTDTAGNVVNDRECRGTLRSVGERRICELDCADYEIFAGLPSMYVTSDRTELVRENGVVKLYEDYKNRAQDLLDLCPDIDGDGIASCVESDTSLCSRMPSLPSDVDGVFTVGGQNLNPYRKDTDGDEFVDGIAQSGETPDRCPFNRAGEGATSSACDQETRVYVSRPLLACFLDRDADGLSDCQEDLNRDGILDLVGGMDSANAGSAPTATDPRMITETNPLSDDTDGDGIKDKVEVQDWGRYTNPADKDTDRDGLPDSFEVADRSAGSPNREYRLAAGVGCGFTPVNPTANVETLVAGIVGGTLTNDLATDPADDDTDDDGISDGVEMKGFDILIDFSTNFANAIDIISNPLSADSDGDGLLDGVEYAKTGPGDTSASAPDGLLQYFESSPCSSDTDGDNISDSQDTNPTSRINTPLCTSSGANGPDADCDGISDANETRAGGIGTDPRDEDSDDDGLWDGDEDVNRNGLFERNGIETDPMNPDTDGDGLSDGVEVNLLHTNPNSVDTDGDGIEDGVEINNPFAGYTPGTDTDPTNPDTDGDGLCDGDRNVTNGGPDGSVTCIRGEDLNVNGERDRDPNNPNRFIEFDPRTPDSDADGELDLSEACRGGQCLTPDNIVSGNSGSQGDCAFNVSAVPANAAPMSMIWMLSLGLLLRVRFAKRSKRNSSPL